MPGYQQALTTLAEVESELGLTAGDPSESYLTFLINTCSDAIAGACNRPNDRGGFAYGGPLVTQPTSSPVVQWVENVSGYATTKITVKHTPIDVNQPVTITFNSGVIDPAIYSVMDPYKGWIFQKGGWYWTAVLIPNVGMDPFPGEENPLYQVTYCGGYVTPQQIIDNPSLDPATSGLTLLPYDLQQACVQMVTYLYRVRGENPLIDSQSLMSYSMAYRKVFELPFTDAIIRRYRVYGTSR